MRKNSVRDGSIATVAIIVLLVVSLLVSLGVAIWAFSERSTYKNESDKISAKAVEEALAAQKLELEKQFDEQEKQPFETYQGPSDLGSITLSYPKTWELYVDEAKSGTAALKAYAHPGYVPSTNGDTSFALRYEVVSEDYANTLKDFDGQVKKGTVRVTPFRAEKVPSVVGAKLEGEIEPKKTGVMVIIPVRDKTLRIWTESTSFTPDFNTILSSLTFVP